MKLSVSTPDLRRALKTVAPAVAGRTAILPVLTHVLLATDGGRLKIAAADDLGITCWIAASVEDEGAITVPARTFTELVALLPPDRVDLELNPLTQALRVTSGRTGANIKGIDAQEFPIIPAFEAAGAAYIDARALRSIIDRVVFAAATDESRPMLTGVLTKLEGDRITMAASDGFRLSVCSATLKEPVAEPRTILIPARAVAEVARIAGNQEEPVAISVTPSRGQAIFHMANVDLAALLIDQRYPDYEPIIPGKSETRAVVSTADLLKACRLASVFARGAADRMLMQVGRDVVTVMARAGETGDNQSRLEASVTGPEMEVAFNVKYLIDALSVVSTPQVAFESNGPHSPGLFKPVGEDNSFHLVIPMRHGD